MFRVIHLCWSWVLMASLMWGAVPVQGQSTPIGNEFQVNVFTTGNQRNPHVASDAAGNFMVLWESNFTTFGRQIFNNGVPGPELVLSLSSNSDLARAPGGEFVVVSEFNSGYSVRAQVFDGLGSPQGSEINVSDGSGSNIADLDVDMVNNDEFVVVWSLFEDEVRNILARQMNVNGSADGDVIAVNSLTLGAQDEPAVALAGDGDFAIVWTSTQSVGDDTAGTSIQGRVYGADGQPVADQFQVNVNTTSRQDRPDIAALADGSWVVAWSDRSEVADTDIRGIALQRLDATGGLLGAPVAVNTYTTGDQILPSVAPLSDGGFIVTWESRGSPGSDNLLFSVQGRIYDSLGQPAGDQFQVNSYAPQTQSRVEVATGPDLRSLVVWESNGSAADDTDDESIQGQLLGPLVPEIFTDGFETGDTASWADVQP